MPEPAPHPETRAAGQRWRRVGIGGVIFLCASLLVLFSFLPGLPLRPDQFWLPKDIAFGIVGIASSILLIRTWDGPWDPLVEVPLFLAIVWTVWLAVFVSQNRDLAWRSLGGFGAALSILLLVRQMSRNGGLVGLALTLALIILAIGILLEAYGVVPYFSEPGRRPGGALGNRNLAGRVFCLALPLFWLLLATRRGAKNRLLVATAVFFAAFVIAISRSRGAWLAASGLVIALPTITLLGVSAGEALRSARLWFATVALAMICALSLPNRLGWSASEMAESARSVFALRTGSGRGRVIQARTTLRMIRASPVFGVGPGNWSVAYPLFANAGDPSYTPNDVYPGPRMPRGDLLSLTAEIGVLGIGLSSAVVIALWSKAIQMLKSSAPASRHAGACILALGTSVTLLGLVDPVMRLAPTAFVVAVATGLALAQSREPDSSILTRFQAMRSATVLACFAGSVYLTLASARELAAVRTMTRATTRADFFRAVSLAPQNVEARVLMAFELARTGRCDLAKLHLDVALRLQPYSGPVKRLLDVCTTQSAK